MNAEFEIIEITEDDVVVESASVDCVVSEVDEPLDGGVVIEEYEPVEQAEEVFSDFETIATVSPEVEEPQYYVRYYVYE